MTYGEIRGRTMKNNDVDRLAEAVADYSMKLDKGDICLINAGIEAKPLVDAFTLICMDRGVLPIVHFSDEELTRRALLAIHTFPDDQQQIRVGELIGDLERLIDRCNAMVIMRCKNMADPYHGVSEQLRSIYNAARGGLFRKMITKKWVILDYPTKHQGEKAGMNFEEFYAYSMQCSLIDYAKLHSDALPLKRIMDRACKVRVTAEETEFTFDKEGINTIMGTGENSYVDGELYTAPKRDSLNGHITYTVPSTYNGNRFAGIRFDFEQGKIVQASCREGSIEALNRILDTDEGSRYIGEFAIGIHPLIVSPMDDIHFDEKILGSFHLTPGQCYTDAYNDNNSDVHWDIVTMLTPEYGGGEIWFDEELIQKDGRFVHPELIHMNP